MTNLSPATRRMLDYAAGYLTLGLKVEAAEALAEIGAAERDSLPVLRMRAFVQIERAEWAAAAELLAVLCERQPEEAGHWIQHAYATRRHTGIEAAHTILRRGLERHPTEATIHFNLACYEAQLGRLAEARVHLAEACRLESSFIEMARIDADLSPLWL